MAEKKHDISKIPRTTRDVGLETIPKHNSSIHVSTKLSFLGRKLLNALLYQAYEHLSVKESFQVDLKTLGALIGFDSKNTAHLKEAITELTKTTIEWDIIAKNGKPKWKISTLLASAEISDGVCTYEYSGLLRRELYNPDKWTRINLAIQRRFSSSYALILYENCVRFKGVKTTGLWDIEDFRRLLGVDGMQSYSAFKVLNDKIIKPAVKEVNRHSDIIIKPYFTKNGRRIATVRFTIAENKQMPLFKVQEEDAITESAAYKELRARGISKVFSKKAVLDFGEDYIFEQLGIVDRYAASGKKLKSKEGLIRKAISDGYSKPEEMAREERKKALDQKRKDIGRLDYKIGQIEQKIRKVEKDYRVIFTDIVQSVFEVSDREEQTIILQDFKHRFPLSAITAHDFSVRQWRSLMNWPSIREYWTTVRGLPCPTFEDFATEHGLQRLENELSKINLERNELVKS